ncbi:GNAT family N-acetyltransferase [Kribbella deserti]|uniref:GNAT family N-acetyltransferase n=1 Tax=Kribbella deserti TaxID=1926257 RepID=A0ABV6QF45_9ACTN
MTSRGVGSLWSGQILRTLAWSSQTPSVAVLVADGAAQALFHFRLLGPPAVPSRFTVGRMPWAAVADCRLHPGGSLPGRLFVGGSSDRWRTEAVRAAAYAVAERVGDRRVLVGFRNIPLEDLDAFTTAGAVSWAATPEMVIENQWTGTEQYLRAMGRKQRSEVRRIERRLAEIPGLSVQLEPYVPVDEASRLLAAVHRRRRPRWWVFPPAPVEYFEQLALCSDVSFIVYRREGRLAAFTMLHDDGTDLVMSVFGQADAAEGGRAGFYLDMFHRAAIHLVENGRRKLSLGKGMQQVKQRFGAEPQPQFLVLNRPSSADVPRRGSVRRYRRAG